MIFDDLAKKVEIDFPKYKPNLEKTKLFEFVGNLAVNNVFTVDNIDYINNEFDLPFDSVAVEIVQQNLCTILERSDNNTLNVISLSKPTNAMIDSLKTSLNKKKMNIFKNTYLFLVR